MAQNYYHKYYNYTHMDRSFNIGDWVWLKLMARLVLSISTLQKGKLSPKMLWSLQN